MPEAEFSDARTLNRIKAALSALDDLDPHGGDYDFWHDSRQCLLAWRDQVSQRVQKALRQP